MVKETDPTVEVSFARPYGEFPEFSQALLELLNYTVNKYSIPETASLKVILGHHGYTGFYVDAQDCDAYMGLAEESVAGMITEIEADFSWEGKLEMVVAAAEYAEKFSEGVLSDPPSLVNPQGDVMSIGEEIDVAINGVYVNGLGQLVDNGIDSFEYIIMIPYYFEAQSIDTFPAKREAFGNNIPLGFFEYGRDGNDKDGTEYDTDDLDNEGFTIKVFDEGGWPGYPLFWPFPVFKGSKTNPTTAIITGEFFMLGNCPVRTNLIEAEVEAIIEVIEKLENVHQKPL